MRMTEVVVLTGASGCLGYHTLKLLISKDDKVSEIRCLDLREPQIRMKESLENELKEFNEGRKEPKKIIWVKGDIRDVNTVEQVLEGANCVIHCAAKIDIWTECSKQDHEELTSINVDGTENLLKASVRLGVSKFVHVSSFEVYASHDTIYYATETTLPLPKNHLFGSSGSSKLEAEKKVVQFANQKLERVVEGQKDWLNAIIVRFPAIYGEYDSHYVSKFMAMTKFFGGKLQRLDNVWIRQQPIYAGNAAWSLICAKNRLQSDKSISGEEFHITDETAIGDFYDFIQPYLESKGMHITKKIYPYLPILFLVMMFFSLKKLLKSLDIFGLFSVKKDRLRVAIEKDQKDKRLTCNSDTNEADEKTKQWYDYVMPQILAFMCISSFLNRTKASLRLDYEPLYNQDDAKRRSLEWYREELHLN